jgi:hypothetical protein
VSTGTKIAKKYYNMGASTEKKIEKNISGTFLNIIKKIGVKNSGMGGNTEKKTGKNISDILTSIPKINPKNFGNIEKKIGKNIRAASGTLVNITKEIGTKNSGTGGNTKIKTGKKY